MPMTANIYFSQYYFPMHNIYIGLNPLCNLIVDIKINEISIIYLLIQVTENEGATLAATHGIGFCEVSVAENTPSLYRAFERLLVETRARPVKQRKFSVSKMIGELYFNVK